MPHRPPMLILAFSLDGAKVRNAKGEDLGHVKEIMMDMAQGRIAYYVLSFGGFLEMGDKLFALPPEALRHDSARNCLVLDVEKEELAHAPGFDKDRWSDMADAQFRDKIYAHYGIEYPTAFSLSAPV